MGYHILLVNDDGINSPGLLALCVALCDMGFEVTVAAPQHEHSGMSHAITILRPLRAVNRKYFGDVDAYAVDGTPADCVKLGLRKLAKTPVDIVISGINNGANLGRDTHYSGTVSAAIEGIFCGVPAIAVSVGPYGDDKDYSFAAEVAAKYAMWLVENPLPYGTMLNINVPNLPKEKISGIRWAALSGAGFDDDYERRVDPHGGIYYWIRGAFDKKTVQGTDLDFFERGYITLTPLKWDMTDHVALKQILGSDEELHILN